LEDRCYFIFIYFFIILKALFDEKLTSVPAVGGIDVAGGQRLPVDALALAAEQLLESGSGKSIFDIGMNGRWQRVFYSNAPNQQCFMGTFHVSSQGK
jgi:hypothetical protein